jgi:hypothetical protein
MPGVAVAFMRQKSASRSPRSMTGVALRQGTKNPCPGSSFSQGKTIFHTIVAVFRDADVHHIYPE